MLVFHIAERSRWEAAKLAGSYAQSTLGETLEEVGFLHASREDQWEGVRERYYADVRQPLVLLVIDTDRLTSPWREDPVGDDTYPHIYGPLNPSAVVEARPLRSAAAPSRSFFQLFLAEMGYRMGAAVLVMLFALVVAGLLNHAIGPTAGLVGALAAVVLGLFAAASLKGHVLKD